MSSDGKELNKLEQGGLGPHQGIEREKKPQKKNHLSRGKSCWRSKGCPNNGICIKSPSGPLQRKTKVPYAISKESPGGKEITKFPKKEKP